MITKTQFGMWEIRYRAHDGSLFKRIFDCYDDAIAWLMALEATETEGDLV